MMKNIELPVWIHFWPFEASQSQGYEFLRILTSSICEISHFHIFADSAIYVKLKRINKFCSQMQLWLSQTSQSHEKWVFTHIDVVNMRNNALSNFCWLSNICKVKENHLESIPVKFHAYPRSQTRKKGQNLFSWIINEIDFSRKKRPCQFPSFIVL